MAQKRSGKKKSAKKKPAKKKSHQAQTDENWPKPKAVLFRPERLKYVRKMIKPEGCVFCNAVDNGPSVETLLLYKGMHAIAILNKYPYNPGHLLVLPRRHCGDLLAMTDAEVIEMQDLIRLSIASMNDSARPSGYNVGLNLGSAAGAGIPEHLHYHVVPRWLGDTNFFPLIAETKVVVETLAETYRRLLPYFQGTK
jgi:ATP adenylyltransferase